MREPGGGADAKLEAFLVAPRSHQAYTAARVSAEPFDLVIFDLTVPGGLGGKDALAELLKIDPHIRAIASSGYSSDPVMANPRTYGFCATLPKPYDIPELIKAVEEARRK